MAIPVIRFRFVSIAQAGTIVEHRPICYSPGFPAR
jgi:hypothetical protein